MRAHVRSGAPGGVTAVTIALTMVLGVAVPVHAWADRPVDLDSFTRAVLREALSAHPTEVAAAGGTPQPEIRRSYGGAITLFASGLALVISGIVVGVVKTDLDNVGATPITLDQARNREEAVFAASVTATLLFAIGGGLAGGGLIWFLAETFKGAPPPATSAGSKEEYKPAGWQSVPLGTTGQPTAPVEAPPADEALPPPTDAIPELPPVETMPVDPQAATGAAVPIPPVDPQPAAPVVNPDTDKDGVLNADDACAEVAGIAGNRGCPDGDEDHDGLAGARDMCPRHPGPAWSGGCTGPDSDGDRTPDSDDQCPMKPGSLDHAGCPPPGSGG